MKKKIPVSLLTFFLTGMAAFAQDASLFIQTYRNPYQQNPAWAGMNGYSEAYFTYQKQLIGSFVGSPEQGNLNFHSPLGKSRSAVGLQANNSKISYLRTTGAVLTFAHRIDFGVNHNMRVGLSGGFTTLGINLEDEDDFSDPALINRLNNRTLMDGQFGLAYQFHRLQLGASLPRLFLSYGINSQRQLTERLYPFRNYIFMASYTWDLSAEVQVKPVVYYRFFEEEKPALEAGGMFTWREKVWAGASYRQQFGTSVFAGIQIKEFLSVGYAYKPTTTQFIGYNTPAHELQLGIRFGKKAVRSEQVVAVEPLTVYQSARAVPVTPHSIHLEPVMPKIDIKTPDSPPVVQKKDIERVKKGRNPLEMQTGNYVVIGAFRIQKNARAFEAQLRTKYPSVKTGFNSLNQIFYVYILLLDDTEAALEKLESTRTGSGFENAWVLKVENR
jgi:type IX secretion system PorP/SprF family membrane protein